MSMSLCLLVSLSVCHASECLTQLTDFCRNLVLIYDIGGGLNIMLSNSYNEQYSPPLRAEFKNGGDISSPTDTSSWRGA
jgi:hypothetical protein